jgi:hypothetical protein
MRRFIFLLAVLLLFTRPLILPAQAEDFSTYSQLTADDKKVWQRILLQEDAYFRPRNADYYLSNTTTPDLAKEFNLAEQYLRGTLPFTGAAAAAPWCQFPARFAFVAKMIYGSYFMPEAYRSCNIPLPELDNTLRADIVQTFEQVDSGDALFHVDLLVQGKRFYNGSILTLNIGFGRRNDTPNHLADNLGALNKAIRLVKSFGGDGAVTILADDSPNDVRTNNHGKQVYRINLPAEKIYFLTLLAFESKRATFPYHLMRANCHTYLEHIFTAVLPESPSGDKKLFFDFMPTFMAANNIAEKPVFEPYRYWPAPRQGLDDMAKQLNWHDYQALQGFLSDGIIPAQEHLKTSKPLRLAIGKAAEQREIILKKSAELLALRDEYLSSELLPSAVTKASRPPVEDDDVVPIFNSTHASTLKTSTLHVNGKTRLQLELDVFNTMADQLQAAAPYGFTMGKLAVQTSEHGLAFDHFVLAEQNSVDNACCGERLYALGFRQINGVSIDLVNNPQKINLEAWKLKPHVELNFSKGLGTISKSGWSVQVLPNLSLLSYEEYIDLNVNASLGWTNGKWAISASKLGKIYGPDDRRSRPDETLRAEYKTSQDARLELSYKHFDDFGTITGVGYVFAF